MVRAELLSIGAELLVGETVDTNAAFLGRSMAKIGLPLAAIRTVPDDRAVIADAFVQARGRSAVVIATGGLGPTHDDLSREGLADALAEELVEDADLVAVLEERFRALSPMPAVNRRQAMRIGSAEALENPIGSAPGWWVDRDGVITVLLPGVPSEMRRMWVDQVRSRLVARFPGSALTVRTVKAFGLGESAIAERLGPILTDPPPGVAAGIYARDDGVHVRFATHGAPDRLTAGVEAVCELLGQDVYGTDDDDLASVALARLGALGVADVCTWEAGTEGALLNVLAAAGTTAGAARYVGGVLDLGTSGGPPLGDAVLQVSLLPQDAGGRSRVRVAMTGVVALSHAELRIHGSGPQRLRRAAFAALDAVRRIG